MANLMRGQFGAPGTNLIIITTHSGAKFRVHRAAAPYFMAFLNELEHLGYKIDPRYSGGYNYRNKAGGRGLSQHAYGNAIDINWHVNKWKSRRHNFPPNIAEFARQFGLEWGGQWKHTPDAMHFEWTGRRMNLHE